MTQQKPIGVGVVGLGFMGRTHVTAYREANKAGFANRLVAVSDRNPNVALGDTSARGNLNTGDHQEALFDPAVTAFYTSPGDIFALEAVDLVSICTHTLSHVDLAIEALEAGKHVLVEKPVALRSAEVERLAAAARASGRICMPAMCLRFWPGWDWLRETIHEGTYGKVRGAVFRRIASHPGWSEEFYGDPEKNGGALFDLHIHDADFLRYCFGPPASVTSAGSLDHVTTFYHYPDGPPHVVAEGGWDMAPGFDFEMNFTINFEQATVDYRLDRDPVLMLFQDGQAEAIPLEDINGYDGEIRHLLSVLSGKTTLAATLDEAATLTRMLEAEAASLKTGTTLSL